jgi:hypothetical protein
MGGSLTDKEKEQKRHDIGAAIGDSAVSLGRSMASTTQPTTRTANPMQGSMPMTVNFNEAVRSYSGMSPYGVSQMGRQIGSAGPAANPQPATMKG